MAEELRPIIVIRRKKVVGGGHHGGAWKVAYADFVTAMMAFFLLMWLLNATTEEQRKGIAEYFSPTIPIHRTSGGGSGPFGGSSVMSEMTRAQNGAGASDARPTAEREAAGAEGETEKDSTNLPLEGLAAALVAKGGESNQANRLLRHIRTRVTDEGLVIEIFDLPETPLFLAGSTEPTETLLALISLIGEIATNVTNAVGVDNHLAAAPLQRATQAGWNLSTTRALEVRGLLAEAGVVPERFSRVTGEADRAPSQEDPRDVRNNRTEIVLLRSDPDRSE